MTRFCWRGQPIEDIEAWATEHGEDMVEVKVRRKEWGLLKGQAWVMEETEWQPRCFFETSSISDGRTTESLTGRVRKPIKREESSDAQV